MNLPSPAFVRFDLFPSAASLVATDGTGKEFSAARTIVTDSEVYVFVDSMHGPVVDFVGQLEDFNGKVTTGWTADLDGGDVLRIRRIDGCGCGSQLRGFRPFPDAPLMANN